jgi:hypothetical protein
MKSILDRLFPKEDTGYSSSRLVARGLEALRLARDSRAVSMGNLRRTPSHFELRIASGLYEELAGIDAINDLAFHLKDEMMKDLAGEKGRTFGDHTIHVQIAQDSGLAENEIYAIIRNPERGGSTAVRSSTTSAVSRNRRVPTAPDDESTRVLGQQREAQPEDEDGRTVVLGEEPPHTVAVIRINRPDGTRDSVDVMSEKIVIGRAGLSGKGLPEGFQKIDIDLPRTVSREQIAITLDDDGWRVERIGSGGVSFIDGSTLEQGASRRLSYTDPVILDGVALRVERL